MTVQKNELSNLKRLRHERGLRILDIANAVGVTPAAITNYENNSKKPRPETAKKLADFYGVTIGYVLGYEELPEATNLLKTEKKVFELKEDTPFAKEARRIMLKNTNYGLTNNFIDIIVAGEDFHPAFVKALKQFFDESFNNLPYLLNNLKNSDYSYLHLAWTELEAFTKQQTKEKE